MRSSAKLKIITHDLEPEMHNPFSLWTGPSSPPFNQPQIIHDSLASSPSSTSEFEFGSIASIQIKDDPPVSPSFATGYRGARATVSSFDSLPPDTKQKIAPITSPTQPSALPSPSVRQLMAEEISGEQEDDFSLDFYSAPQTPTPKPRKSAPADLEQWPLNQDEPSLSIVTSVGQRKSNSGALDRHGTHGDDSVALPVTQKNQLLQSSKSESNSHFALWTSSSAWEKSEEVKKQGSKSGVKWAFKDLLRRTVPSSKAEAHYITKTMGASSSKKHLKPSSKTKPDIVSSTSLSTPHASRPSTPGRSPTHSSATSARSSPRHPSTPGRTPTTQTLNRTPTPSPPQSPLSHYQQNKAQSLELTRKTFLPYRQSLLGCLGGPGAFPPVQQAS